MLQVTASNNPATTPRQRGYHSCYYG
jgi:hypothetical protein